MTKFTALPVAAAQTGAEILAEVQGGISKQVTTAQIAALAAVTVNSQIGISYSLQTTDNNGIVTLDNVNPITLTCPAGLGAAFTCMIIQLGAGQVTIVAGAGATINSFNGLLNLAGQYAGATIAAPTANAFIAMGALV